MASDYLLEIDGVQGESQDAKHPNAIEIESWSIGGVHPGSAASGTGDSTGKVEMGDFQFTKMIDKASSTLLQKMTSGKHFNKAVLYCRKATGDGGQMEFLKVTLNEVLVSSWHQGGSNGSNVLPTDSFSLNYAKIEYEYKPQTAAGTLGASSPIKYDIKKRETS